MLWTSHLRFIETCFRWDHWIGRFDLQCTFSMSFFLGFRIGTLAEALYNKSRTILVVFEKIVQYTSYILQTCQK